MMVGVSSAPSSLVVAGEESVGGEGVLVGRSCVGAGAGAAVMVIDGAGASAAAARSAGGVVALGGDDACPATGRGDLGRPPG